MTHTFGPVPADCWKQQLPRGTAAGQRRPRLRPWPRRIWGHITCSKKNTSTVGSLSWQWSFEKGDVKFFNSPRVVGIAPQSYGYFQPSFGRLQSPWGKRWQLWDSLGRGGRRGRRGRRHSGGHGRRPGAASWCIQAPALGRRRSLAIAATRRSRIGAICTRFHLLNNVVKRKMFLRML